MTVLLFKPCSYQTMELLSVLGKQVSLQKQGQGRDGLPAFLKNKKAWFNSTVEQTLLGIFTSE